MQKFTPTTVINIEPRKRGLDILIYFDTMDYMMNELSLAKAIADDVRWEIMEHLCCVWLSAGEVVAKLDGKVNQPTVSHHLKRLEEAGLVSVRQEGRQRFYTLNQDQVVMCCGNLMRRFAPDYSEQVIRIDSIEVNKA